MTVEKRVVFDLLDTKAVLIECDGCQGRLTVPLAKSLELSSLIKCPFCHKEWLGGDYGRDGQAYLSVTRAIREVAAMQDKNKPGFHVRIEFEHPSA